jgi:hypothetical protein
VIIALLDDNTQVNCSDAILSKIPNERNIKKLIAIWDEDTVDAESKKAMVDAWVDSYQGVDSRPGIAVLDSKVMVDESQFETVCGVDSLKKSKINTPLILDGYDDYAVCKEGMICIGGSGITESCIAILVTAKMHDSEEGIFIRLSSNNIEVKSISWEEMRNGFGSVRRNNTYVQNKIVGK